jgi:hypothetical protein
MSARVSKKWLLLIHQIPPKPNALRVKIWRRLQQVGAVAIKQSVYVMPYTDSSREDLSWILKEIMDGGGEGSISQVRFIEGLSDEQVVALFQNARQSDYDKIINAGNRLITQWSSGEVDPRDPGAKAGTQVAKLRRQFDRVAAMDFFNAPGGETAEGVLKKLSACLSGETSNLTTARGETGSLKGKVWVTRRDIFVDRMACGWLIRRYVDGDAKFKFVATSTYVPGPDELRFDMFEGEFTHQGDCCTFEVMIQRLGLEDPALAVLAEVIHDIDLKERKYGHAETDGLNALLTGLAAADPDDHQRMAQGIGIMENMYAFFQRQRKP